MTAHLPYSRMKSGETVRIGGSKSETNRWLILSALYGGFELTNASDSEDSTAVAQALNIALGPVNIGHAGTAMRFLTAYYASLSGCEVVLDGSARMRERPIGILVGVLKELGADISYIGREGFPPLYIRGKSLRGDAVQINASVSSQYLSALLMVGATFKNGLELRYSGVLTSTPYVEMTLQMLRKIGISLTHEPGSIRVSAVGDNFSPMVNRVTVAPDWSSASYFYSCVALSSPGTMLRLKHFSADDLQGDRALVKLFTPLGVETQFKDEGILLTKIDVVLPLRYTCDLSDTPDLAQTIAVCCLGLGIGAELYGLHTLAIKETDRLAALKIEMEKLGAKVCISSDRLEFDPLSELTSEVYIDTYQDHRMAMAFAPLALKVSIAVRDSEVVKKSFPDFWEKWAQIGFNVQFS